VSPNIGLRNLICSAYSFGASFLFIIQFPLSYPESASEAVLLRIRSFVSVICFPNGPIITPFN
jgi:hypothetical protein